VLHNVIWVVPLMFASEFLGYVVVIGGQERQVARAVIISTGLNVALNLLLVPQFGFLGAATMTVVTEIILVSQYGWVLRAQLHKLNWRLSLLRPLVAALLMAALALTLHNYLPLLLNIAISGLAYMAMLPILGVIGQSELHALRGMLRRHEASGVGIDAATIAPSEL
jgi:O-antigen/teichoic acid export membrane protein